MQSSKKFAWYVSPFSSLLYRGVAYPFISGIMNVERDVK